MTVAPDLGVDVDVQNVVLVLFAHSARFLAAPSGSPTDLAKLQLEEEKCSAVIVFLEKELASS